MLIDSLVLAEGSTVVNLTVPFGTAFPSSPSTGELFYKTTDSTLYVHTGATWSGTGSGGGGGATVGGADTQVQYNNAGALAGSASFIFNSNTNTLTVANLAGAGANITNINAANISSGYISVSRLGTGTPSSTTFLAGDGTWSTITSIGAASNLAGGITGQVPYQTGTGTTAFINNSAGVLQKGTSNGVPIWTLSPGLNGTNFANIPNRALENDSFVLGGTTVTLGTTVKILSGFTHVDATTFNGNLNGTALNATNIAGGASGQIPYQSGIGVTSFITGGSTGQVLTLNSGGTPTWSNVTTSALTGTTNPSPSGTVTGTYAGANYGDPVIYLTNATSAVNNRAMRFAVTPTGQFKMTLLPDALTSETSFFAVDRSSSTASLITLTSTGLNLAVGTGGLQLNGSAGTSGQVLTSNGAGAAPTWQSVTGATAVTLSATGAYPTITGTGVFAGIASTSPKLEFYSGSAPAHLKKTYFYSDSSGVFHGTLENDIGNAADWLTMTRTYQNVNLLTLTSTGLNLAVGTRGLQLNGSAGTSGQVLTSNGASAAPTWQSVTAANLAGGSSNQVPYQTAAGTTSFFASANYGVHITGATGTPTTLPGAAGVLVGSASATPAWTTSPSLSGLTVTGSATLTQYVEYKNTITASATTTIDCSISNNFVVTMAANITTLALTNVPSSANIYNVTLILIQDATGGRTLAWPVAVKWPSGNVPSLTSTANKIDVITLMTYDGGTTWLGFVGNQNY